MRNEPDKHPGGARPGQRLFAERSRPTVRSSFWTRLVSTPGADASVLTKVAQQYAQMPNVPKLESTLERLVKMPAAGPEAWYDLAALKASLGKSSEALAALKQALELSAARLKRDPTARDLLKEAREDARFDTLRQSRNSRTGAAVARVWMPRAEWHGLEEPDHSGGNLCFAGDTGDTCCAKVLSFHLALRLWRPWRELLAKPLYN